MDEKETMEIPLTRGQVVIVDAEDFEWLSQYKWQARWDKCKKGYYAGTGRLILKSFNTTLMHRLIMGAKKGEIVDHIDGNGLNNRKSNLRIVTFTENAINHRIRSDNTSSVTGVRLRKDTNRWYAFISVNNKETFLGSFIKFEDAVEARRNAEKEHYGDFIRKSEHTAEVKIDAPKRDSAPLLWYLLGYGEVYVVPLTQNQFSIIDKIDYDSVKNLVWHTTTQKYAATRMNGKVVLLHRLVSKPEKGLVVDHINGDRLDNRRCNLRNITQLQNTWNYKNESKITNIKNITRRNKRWIVRMYIDYKETWLGSFSTLEEALEIRNEAYKKYRGEFARYDD
jgi:hypothetical protein